MANNSSFLDVAYDVLKTAKLPLTYQEVWDETMAQGFDKKMNIKGKTPSRSMGAILYVDVRDNLNSKFIKASSRPARFFLKERKSELSGKLLSQVENIEEDKTPDSGDNFKEKDLHPLLAYYANKIYPVTNRRVLYTKTISHEKALKKGFKEWVYPDMVGFYFPTEQEWEDEVLKLNNILDDSLRLYSFELKKALTRTNYRESYFQAVSNSSWAHEGYLVAAEIYGEEDFLLELERLTTAFGIGIIQLDIADIDSSVVRYPARIRETLDWETVNKLCYYSPDFKEFLKCVTNDFKAGRVFKEDYDHIPDNPVLSLSKKIKHTK